MPYFKEIERGIIERLKLGDEAAFRLVFDHYRNRLYAFSLKLTKSQDFAEEIVHDVFLKVWLNRQKINPDLSFNAFLFKITKNLSINFLKKAALDQAIRRSLVLEANKEDYSTIDALTSADYEASLEKAINHLPPQQQKVFRMSRIEGYTHAEIAEQLRLTKGTVKNYMILAIESISKFLKINADKVLLVILSCFGIRF
jgi:RNA polymerase sigma-70 factor (family 1)